MSNITEKTKERFKSWWEIDLVDRALIQVWAPRKGKEDLWNEQGNEGGVFTSYKTIKEWKKNKFDYNFLIGKQKEFLSSVYYGGDAFPTFCINLGPGSIAADFGCNANFRDETIWYGPPILKNYKNIENKYLQEKNVIWGITQRLTKISSENSNNNYFVTAADLGMNLDIIASLRGAERMLFDLLEHPKEVKKLISIVSDIFINKYDKLYDLVKNRQDFFLGWLPVYSEGKNYPIQCDFSAMISPKMFEEFIVSDLVKISKHLDKSIYHLDGPDAVRHLDIILDIKDIDAIQWAPGKGSPSAVHWIPMLKKIQKKKKALVVYAENPKEVERLLEELEPEGLLISTKANSEEEADEIVKNVKKLSIRKIRKR